MTLVACDTDDGRTIKEPTSEQRAAMTTTTTSTTVPGHPARSDITRRRGVRRHDDRRGDDHPPPVFSLQAPWPTGGAIDARFTCDGEDRSPTLIWTAPPAGTVEMALLVTDDDADGFVHWAVAGIPPTAGEVGEERHDHRCRRRPQRHRSAGVGRSVPTGRRARTPIASRSTRSTSRSSCRRTSPAPTCSPSPRRPAPPPPRPPGPTPRAVDIWARQRLDRASGRGRSRIRYLIAPRFGAWRAVGRLLAGGGSP